jgi:hypothetical protein
VKDSAHVLKGARGAHVGKIQTALFILEGALIDDDELTASAYGPSTASAVLAYKKKRDIVNRSYQQRADDIVGKMTIASLDRELAIGEQKPVLRSCREPLNGPASVKRRASLVAGSAVGDAPQQQFPAILSVLFQLVRVNGALGKHSFALVAETLRRANELVAPFGQRVASINGFSFSINFKLKVGQREEFEGLRKGAEAAMPGFGKAIRVIICPFRVNDRQEDDLKTNAVSMSIEGFDRFIVMNSNLLRSDRGTLLHEMIHCSRDSLMGEIEVHDADGSGGIFSWDANRTLLFPHRAKALQGAPFAFAR